MKIFELHRTTDVSGVSGTGIVAQGVIFDNGKCALTWLTKHTSVAVYDEINQVIAIHGHDGNTRVIQIADLEDAQTLAFHVSLDFVEGVTPCAFHSPGENKPGVQWIIEQREKFGKMFRQIELKEARDE